MQVQPYLFFNGRCEEAAEFYRTALGAEVVSMMRMSDSPEAHPPGMLPPGSERKIMHMSLRIGEATVMASDGRCQGPPDFKGFSLSLDAADAAHAQRMFDALGEGGKVEMPLGKTFFASCFGMVTDRFGLAWMIIVN
jgi:PhnB protein